MPGRRFVPVVDHPGDVAVWRFWDEGRVCAEAEAVLGHCTACRPLSESPCVESSGEDAANLIVLVRTGLVTVGAAILLETSDA